MSDLLVVVGATGLQGRGVIRYFQREQPSWKLRGLTRDPSSSAATALAESGVEVVRADLNEISSLKTAFAGATVIFAYTDVGGIIRGPQVLGKVMKGELQPPIGVEVFKVEYQQGKNVVDAAATVPELKRLIWSDLSNASKWSKGKYTQSFHFDAKAAVTEYMFALEALKGKASALQMGVFASNVAKDPEMYGFSIQKDGSARMQYLTPGDNAYPWIDVEQDTGAFVKALIDAPAPIALLGVSEFISVKQWFQLLCSHLGISGRYEHIPLEDFAADDPLGIKVELGQSVMYVDEFGYTGGDPNVVLPEELEKQGYSIPRTKMVDHIKREDWSKAVNAKV